MHTVLTLIKNTALCPYSRKYVTCTLRGKKQIFIVLTSNTPITARLRHFVLQEIIAESGKALISIIKATILPKVALIDIGNAIYQFDSAVNTLNGTIPILFVTLLSEKNLIPYTLNS